MLRPKLGGLEIEVKFLFGQRMSGIGIRFSCRGVDSWVRIRPTYSCLQGLSKHANEIIVVRYETWVQLAC